MRINDLTDIAMQALGNVMARVRRDALLIGICAVCGLIAVIMAISASILALEPYVGVVYARLIIAGVFMLILIVAALMLRSTPAPARPAVSVNAHVEATASARSAQFAQLAMIIEAVMLGYSMSRKERR